MKGHKYGVYCILLGASNKQLFSGSADNRIGVWTCRSRKCERFLEGHIGTVVGLIKSKNEKFLFSIGKDNQVIIWTMKKYEIVNKLDAFSASNSPCTFALSDQFYTLFGRDRKDKSRLKAVNLLSGETMKLMKLHTKSIRCMILDLEDEFLFTGGTDGVINVLRVEDTALVRAITSHSGPINCLAVSLNGRFLASASNDNTTRLFDKDNGFHPIHVFTHKVEVSSLIFSLTNKKLITGGWHFKPIKIWFVGFLEVPVNEDIIHTPGKFYLAQSPLNFKEDNNKTVKEKVRERVLNFAKTLNDQNDLDMTQSALQNLEILNGGYDDIPQELRDNEKDIKKILQHTEIDVQGVDGGTGVINHNVLPPDYQNLDGNMSRDFGVLATPDIGSLNISSRDINVVQDFPIGLESGVSTITNGVSFQKKIKKIDQIPKKSFSRKNTKGRRKTKIRIK
jgi:WD40 repeat protein